MIGFRALRKMDVRHASVDPAMSCYWPQSVSIKYPSQKFKVSFSPLHPLIVSFYFTLIQLH